MILFRPNTSFFSIFFKNLKIKIYKGIILQVVLYDCEAWSLTLREKRRNKITRRIFGSKKGANAEWRRLQNEDIV